MSLFDRLGNDLVIFVFFYKFQTMVGDESLALQVQELMVRNHCIHVLYLIREGHKIKHVECGKWLQK